MSAAKNRASKTPATATTSSERTDLLALTPDALAALSNRGLVKRAQRMLATGHGPVVQRDEAGAVSGHFERRDVVCRLEAGRPLAAARCDCGAVSVCYHAIATVLAFRTRAQADLDDSTGADEAEGSKPWSPAEFDDKDVATMVARLGMARARRLLAGGLVVTVSVDGGEPVARLPACTLRFLVPHDLSYARCDCEIAVGCEHLPIAVWAFRQAGDDALTERTTVELAATGELDLAPTTKARDLAQGLLWCGVVGATDKFEADYVRARDALSEGNQIWPLSLVEDLRRSVQDYRARSARYRAANAGSQVAGLEARWRLANNDTGTIPAAAVLGTTEAGDARMDQLRLMSLGVRKTSETSSETFLVDLDTSNVSVLRDGATVSSGVDTSALAAGQMVTQAARRRANRELVMVASGGAKTSVTPNSADWKGVRAPVLVSDVADFAQAWATRAPSVIRPRVLAENVVVLPVDEVCDVRWAPGEQALAATVVLANEGGTVDLVRRYSAAAPGAIPCLASLLTSEEDRIHFVSGDLRRTSSGFAIDPLAVMTGKGLVVPDLMPTSSFEAEVGDLGSEASPLGAVLDEALAALDDGVHRGLLASTAGWLDRLKGSATSLDAHGLTRLGEAMRRCATAVDQVRTGGRQAEPRAPERWLDVYIGLLMAREQVHQ